jgi:hypothetical protein
MFAFDKALEFFHEIGELEFAGSAKAEELAKEVGVELPDWLKGATVTDEVPDDFKGVGTFNFSTFRFPMLARLVSFLAKTKCWLVCVEHGDHIHCVHICVTCFDGWPGPGCYLHGSWA